MHLCRWSALSRKERYRSRCGEEGAAELEPALPMQPYLNWCLTSFRWSALSRNERYRSRCGAEGAAELDAANPLPDRVDPITLEPVVSPAISPYGHVMGAATWKVSCKHRRIERRRRC